MRNNAGSFGLLVSIDSSFHQDHYEVTFDSDTRTKTAEQ